ncbi:putative esterase [Symmachiella macrocystis]|uniref:Putative esterase n=1 Tax=Symmachiella macrocystis TaxID=2527985 RepID=A0A5C6B5H3_9PLAN|nr:alpha/beta hydrolase-fold protein [Symmachiella macrocystis]TWU06822.1 putative esterase [Symmachiella macrocystis]
MTHDQHRALLLSGMTTLLVLHQAVLESVIADEKVSISTAQQEKHEVQLHTVASPYQAGETQIRILLPRERKPDEKFKVLYVLPVEAGNGQRWGDPVAEVVKHDLHNQHRLICVFPTFSALPWYADHPHDLTIRQESYFIKVVVPIVEQAYPADATPGGRLLVGFSKSGYGAYSLLLRHPKLFSQAASWDAPLMVAQPNKYGMGPIFGTQENFEKYRVTSLLKKRALLLQKSPRLILTGYGGFQQQHTAVHALMDELKIKHLYRNGPKREHSWNSGWLPEAVGLMLESR